MSNQEEKPSAKNLIANFEKGNVAQNSVTAGEKPIARPGAARKLQQVYEDKSKPNPTPEITKGPARKVVSSSRISGPKNVLVVFAHWEKKSFNAAMFDCAVKVLKEEGHNVQTSDLYAMKWNASASQQDIKGEAKNKEKFNYLDEVFHAVQNGTLAKDISEEHKKIAQADLIIFQFPLHWFSFPAIMKGWFDRCFTNGFSFNTEKGQLFDNGLMKGKKAVLSFTTGGTASAYSDKGIDGDINVLLWPMQYGTLRFAGFDVLAPQITYNIMHSDADMRKEYLQTWEQRLKTIWEEKPIKFVSLGNFSMAQGLVIAEDSPVMKTVEDGLGLTVGQNLGKPYPRNSMTHSS